MSLARHQRRLLGMGVAGSVLAATLVPLAAAVPALADSGTAVITSGSMSVEVSTAFPQALKYTLGAKSMTGATAVGNQLRINGVDQAVTVTSKVNADSTAIDYDIKVPGLDGVSLKAQLSVANNVVAFNITEIKEAGTARVATIQIMDQDLVTVNSAQPGASIASAVVSVNRAVSGDTFTPITAATAVDVAAKTSMVAIASNDALAAGFESNSLYDSGMSEADKSLASSDRGRFWRQVKDNAGVKSVGISSGAWLYRAKGASDVQTEKLPMAKVIITDDANADGKVDWQDGAIASRDIEIKPAGWEDVKNRVVQTIPFNFASQATNPFLRTLDDVKHVSLATDGLGQLNLLKGYTSEGHDSANSDFGDNFNTRAGGVEDMNTLLKQAKNYGATFSVHMNNTEAYPEANSFNDAFVTQPPAAGWNWLEQSYYIDQRNDILSGNQNTRIKQLADATDNNLTTNYIDVYYESGWLGQKLQDNIIANGFSVSSEFAAAMPRNNTWSHWAVDEKYGGTDTKGWNSQILRFAQNSQRDTWNPDPRLGTPHIIEWQGWTGQNDYNKFLKNVWDNNVPAKFVQQQEIKTWTPEAITLTNNVSITGTTLEDRIITQDGVKVLDGHNYLLPWSSDPVEFGKDAKNDPTQTKLYNYSAAGGTQTWTLTPAFANQSSLKLYELTAQGRTFVADVPVSNKSITLNPKANTAYVLVPTTALATAPAASAVDTTPTNSATVWGEGSGIVDPGFNSGNLSAWNPTGTVALTTSAKGLTSAEFGASASSISQQLGALKKGTYSVSAWVGIDPDRAAEAAMKTRATTISASVSGSPAVTNTIDSVPLRNTVAADQKNNTYTQRLRVLIDVKNDGDNPTVTFSSPSGATVVKVDDVRVIKTQAVTAADVTTGNPSGVVLAEDFENVDQGWGPFVKGNSGGITDPRSHLAPKHAPFTQKGSKYGPKVGSVVAKPVDDVLDGQFSMKSHEENGGLVYRTTMATMPFKAGHDYEVSFDYQSSKANEYQWVGGYDSATGAVQTEAKALPVATTNTRWVQNFTASACGTSYVGLNRNGSADAADVSVDNLLIRDLGVSSNTPACAQLNLTQGEAIIEQNAENNFTTTFTSNEKATVNNVAVKLEVPAGWTATASNASTAASLAAGGKLVTNWKVFAPALADGNYTIKATSTYGTTVAPVGSRSSAAELNVYTLPNPPVKDTFASDMQWIGTPTNGWGPAEKNLSNGEQGSGDGAPLSVDGTVYAKGLGIHAASKIKYFVGSQCTAFTAVIGIDDAQGAKGSVFFQVLGDGVELYKSPILTGASAALPINAPLNGAKYVELIVDPNGNNGNDWADWANAKFICSDSVPALVLAPVVNPGGPLEQGKSYTVTVGDLQPGSEATFSLGKSVLGKATANTTGVASYSYKVAADAAAGTGTINVAGTDSNGNEASGSVKVTFAGPLPKAPTEDSYASDLPFVGTPVNEWGPVERDQNNGENAEGDGTPITLKGKVYAKGLGVHADSSVSFYLGAACTAFSATVGIDDAKLPKAHRGNVVFSVVGDGKELESSPQLTIDKDLFTFNVDVTNVNFVDLLATKILVDGKNGDEWADWADAKFSCSAEVPALTLAPVVAGGNSVQQGDSVAVTVADLAPNTAATINFGTADPLSATVGTDGVATFALHVASDAAVGVTSLVAHGTDKNGKAANGSVDVSVTAKPVPVSLSVEAPAELVIGKPGSVVVSNLGKNASVTLTLGSLSLGTSKANANGVAKFNVKLAKGTPTGNATLTASGIASNGLAATGTTSVVVKADDVKPTKPKPLALEISAPATALTPGQKLTLKASGLLPGSQVRAELHSTPVVLGSSKANAQGVATLAVTIPANTPAGQHTLFVFGTDDQNLSSQGSTAVVVLAAGSVDPPVVPSVKPSEQPTTQPSEQPSTGATDSATGGATSDPTDSATSDATGSATGGATNSSTSGATNGATESATSDPTDSTVADDPTANAQGPDNKLPNTGASAILPIAALAILAMFAGAAVLMMRRRSTHS